MSIFDDDIPTTIDYALVSGPIRVNDNLASSDLTVDRALSKIPNADRESYAALYRLFENNSETIGSRHFGERLPGVAFPHAAQRGIHTPSQKRYAATVTLTKKSLYSDGTFADLGDGTWALHYCEHRNNTSNEKVATWNQPLINCLIDGIPVGVFVQEGNSGQTYLRALAFVEEYDPAAGLFVLHGPVTPETETHFKVQKTSYDDTAQNSPSLEELEKDSRRIVSRKAAVREGQQKFRSSLLRAYDGRCAVTEYDVDPVLQAAHIISYRGTPSNATSNGIILRSDIHTLFDRLLLGIDPSNFRIVISDSIGDSPYSQYDGKQLFIPRDKELRPSETYIAASFAKFKQAQAIS